MATRTLLLTLLVTLLLGAAPGVAGAGEARESMRLRAAIRALPQAAETPAGYDRDLFKHWVDADDDCQDTREEVLISESEVPLDGCTVTEGEWFSPYDHETWTLASDVDIDHMVPLKEAWDSGARKWDDDRRELYANDLGDARALVAVTDNVNQSKGDRDVAEWLPRYDVCRYVRQWVAVKLRWRLAADAAEAARLGSLAGDCRNTVLKFVRVPVAAG
jgi:hypothetical protein